MTKREARLRHDRAAIRWTLAGIVVMQLAIGLAVEIALPQVRDPEYTYRENRLRERIREAPGKPVVVVVGSSRTLNGFDAKHAADLLDQRALVFNFGIPSSGPFLERIWLERLHAGGIKPDHLFIEVIPAHYNSRALPADQRSLDGARLTAVELSDLPLNLTSIRGPLYRWALGRAFPTYRHQAELRASLRIDEHAAEVRQDNELQIIDRFGWQPREAPAHLRPALTGLAHRQYDPCFKNFRLDEHQVERLRLCIESSQNAGISTHLILPPEGTEFRNLYSAEMHVAIDRMLENLRQKYRVTVVDARNWVEDNGFSDMHHLQPEGARVFSDRLAREAIAPALRQTSAIAQTSP